jgi:hypothetical protein
MSRFDTDDEEVAADLPRRIRQLSRWQPTPGPWRAPSSSPGAVTVRSRVRYGAWSVLAAGAAFALAVAAGGLGNARVRSEPPGAATVTTAASSGPSELSRVSLAGPVYDLAYDAPRRALWFAIMFPGADALYRYDLASGHLTSWPLPPTDYDGYLDHIAVAPDGSVWLTEKYTVVRFDPSTAAMATMTFALADVDATATALSQNDPSPGTWPSAFTFSSTGDAVVSRHNVTSLITLDAKLEAVGRIPLPAGLAGPGDLTDVSGLIYLAPYGGSAPLTVIDEQGNVAAVGGPGVVQIAVIQGRVLAIGQAGVEWVSPTVAGTTIATLHLTTGDRVIASGENAIVYVEGAGSFEQISNTGAVISTFSLPDEPMSVPNPAGQMVTVNGRHEVGGLASDSPASIWYVDVTVPALVHLQL